MVVEKTSSEKSNRSDRIRRAAFILIGFVISGVALFSIFKDIDFQKVLDSADRIRLMPLIGSIAIYWCVGIVSRAGLVRFLLRSIGVVPLSRAYRYICVGFLVNNVMPLRMGEVVRIGGIARSSNLGFASVAGGLAVERLLDMVFAALFGLVAIIIAPMSDDFRNAVLVPDSTMAATFEGIRTAVFFIGPGMVAILIFFMFIARQNLKKLDASKHGRITVFVWNLVIRFAEGFGMLGTWRGVLGAFALSSLIWTSVIAVMLLRLAAFDLPPSLPIVFVLVFSLGLSVALPSAPGYVGVYHAAAAMALMLFGVEEEVALGFAIFSHFTDILPGNILGMGSMAIEGLSFRDLRRRDQSSQCSIG
ncbi:MAG: flippase-like domain-containing protein [Deltaproteobacteria bacterium]|nr:flippase-like domain-containing protein [Deltaproteobacteria bacterium]